MEAKIGIARRILDVVAARLARRWPWAMSGLQAEYVVGVDTDASTIETARVRAARHGFGPDRVRFETVSPEGSLPFANASFDLVTCVSVMEFISTEQSRIRFVTELLRVVRPRACVPGDTEPIPLARISFETLVGRLATHSRISLVEPAVGDAAARTARRQ